MARWYNVVYHRRDGLPSQVRGPVRVRRRRHLAPNQWEVAIPASSWPGGYRRWEMYADSPEEAVLEWIGARDQPVLAGEYYEDPDVCPPGEGVWHHPVVVVALV